MVKAPATTTTCDVPPSDACRHDAHNQQPHWHKEYERGLLPSAPVTTLPHPGVEVVDGREPESVGGTGLDQWWWSRARTVRSGLGWDRTESSFGRLIRAHLLLFNFCFYRMEAFFAEQAQGTRVVSFSDLSSALHFREFEVGRVRCSHAAAEHPDPKNAP